jgi:hypothetical protein
VASPSLPVQTAIQTRLSGDATLMGLVTRVGDNIPDGQKFPYVVIGEETESADNTHTDKGRDSTLTLHVWSRALGFKEAKTIASRIDDLLDEHALVVTGWRVVRLSLEFTNALRDPDGITRHLVLQYRIETQEA